MDWFHVWGDYAGALVAADTDEEAVQLARQDDPRCWHDWSFAELAEDGKPGSPTAKGVYFVFAE